MQQVKYYWKLIKNIFLFCLLLLPFCFSYFLRIETILVTVMRDKIFTTENKLIIANSVILIITMIAYSILLSINFLINSFLKLEKFLVEYWHFFYQRLLKKMLFLASIFCFNYNSTARVLKYLIINAAVNIFLLFNLQQIAIFKKSIFFRTFKKSSTPDLIFNV